MKAIMSLIFGVAIGWLVAHGVIATECEKLTSFYVGNQVFICKLINTENTEFNTRDSEQGGGV